MKRQSDIAGPEALPRLSPRAAAQKRNYLSASRWRRVAERELAAAELTLAQWLVLEAAAELIHESRDAVNQNEIARRLELDRMTVSQVMQGLADRSLVDRGPDMTGRAYRIWLTVRGQQALRAAAKGLDRASKIVSSSGKSRP